MLFHILTDVSRERYLTHQNNTDTQAVTVEETVAMQEIRNMERLHNDLNDFFIFIQSS